MKFDLSFVSMIVPRAEGKEPGVEGKKSCMEEGSRMEENGSLSRLMEGWEEVSRRLSCVIYTPIFTIS